MLDVRLCYAACSCFGEPSKLHLLIEPDGVEIAYVVSHKYALVDVRRVPVLLPSRLDDDPADRRDDLDEEEGGPSVTRARC